MWKRPLLNDMVLCCTYDVDSYKILRIDSADNNFNKLKQINSWLLLKNYLYI